MAPHYHLSDEEIENITQFSKFHDIGKLALPVTLLLKPDFLSEDEQKQLIGHIETGVAIIGGIIDSLKCTDNPCICLLKDIVSYHHEFLDGTGFPHGLKQDDIPVSARIIAVANVFDALTSKRTYKQAWDINFALLELEKMVFAGKLDRHCVTALHYYQDELKQIIDEFPEADDNSPSGSDQ